LLYDEFLVIIQTSVLILGAINMQIQIGQTVEIVYLDKVGKISQRKIEIGIRNGRIRATCKNTGASRVFLTSNILSWQAISEKLYA
jgi:predicted DNA-binding transcriptional regulator YafY